MKTKSEDKKADIKEAADRGESFIQMEPLLLGEGSGHRAELTDLVVELVGKGAGFRRSLPGGIVAALADLVRAMNCYYSNLIEGHDTHPIDIERALKNDYSTDPHKLDLQLEAKAHIAVQRWIDDGNLRAKAATADGLREIHRRFCEMLPEDLLWVEEPGTPSACALWPANCDSAMCRSDGTYRSAPAPFRDFFPASRTYIAALAGPMRFSRQHPRITASCGFIHSSTAMVV
jgi:hypothetical protein